MSIAISTGVGLTIAAGVGGGVALYEGHRQSKAAKEAAKIQTDAAKEARAYADPLYERARAEAAQVYNAGQAGLSPFTQQGTQGLYALSDFLGVPRGTAPAPTAPVPVAPVAAPVAPNRPRPPDAPIVGQAVPRPGGPIPRAGAPAAPATESSYVTLRAPNGQTQPVPAEHVNYYLARGATRV
jgi:hypothetical protein